jgi:hypothetical protein
MMEVNTRGEIVRSLGLYAWEQYYPASKMDRHLNSMLPQLTHLEQLFVGGAGIARSICAYFTTTPAPSSLTWLDMAIDETDTTDLTDLIASQLLPSIQYLRIQAYGLMNRSQRMVAYASPDDTNTTFAYTPLIPPRHLVTLDIWANFRSRSICKLIVSTESTKTILRGPHVWNGLAALRNSEVMRELVINYKEEQEEGVLDEVLLKFTNLRSLNMAGDNPDHLSDRFFTNYFTPELPLQSLHLGYHFDINFPDLMSAFSTKPSSLKTMVFDTDFDYYGYDELKLSVETYRSGGVEVSGLDVIALHREEFGDDSDDEVNDSDNIGYYPYDVREDSTEEADSDDEED